MIKYRRFGVVATHSKIVYGIVKERLFFVFLILESFFFYEQVVTGMLDECF